jgi:CRP-like cAMP-binding protein
VSATPKSIARTPANQSALKHQPLRVSLQNQLLAALPAEVYRRISQSLETLPLVLKDVLQKPGEPIEDVYFPGGGFCSILTVLDDGSMVEVATIGREGMVGVSAILDRPQPAPSTTIVQAAAGTCYRMSIEAFRHELNRRGPFYALLTRYAVAHFGFVMQSTACNAKHSVEQRLARWLLLAHDRIGEDEFPLTQEFAAMMLGASRPTVTAVAGTLQRAGVVAYHRGILRIVNRVKLEKTSCECYRTTTRILNEVTDQ